MKFICIGRNYRAHAAELKNEIPDKPVLFLKPDTAMLKPGQDFYLPEFSQDVHHEAEVAIRIARAGKYIRPEFALSYVEALSLGIDFTARDLQNELKSKGLPWEIAKAFNGSAPVGDWLTRAECPENVQDLHFELTKNGALVQKGWTGDMLFTIQDIIVYASQFFTLKTGDIILTGTPAGVGPVQRGDVLEGTLQGRKVLTLQIR
jgi:2-keto-4-pentenoate hydratase/2-oxohepta-3-ene-1,7-dioic acid hydratase in catechol pathway